MEKMDLSDELRNYLSSGKSIDLWVEAYSAMQPSGYNYPWFKRVVFLWFDELNKLVVNFDKISSTIKNADRREALYNAILEIFQDYTGEEEIEVIKKYPLADFIRIIVGRDRRSSSRLIGEDLLLEDIKDPERISDKKLNDWVQQFETSCIKLKSIRDEGLEFPRSFKSGGNTFFWIDDDIFP